MKLGMIQMPHMRQEMKLAPQMVKALQLLQAPLPELRGLIQAELESNPVLEEVLGDESAPATTAEAPAPTSFDEVDQENDFESDDFEREMDGLGDILEKQPREDVSSLPTASPEAEEKRQHFLDSITAPPSLHSHLEEQLNESGLSEVQKQAGTYIIGNVDDNGWLTESVDEIAREAGVSTAIVQEVLAVVQEFDPPGVGSRDLKECLWLQLKRLGHTPNSIAARLVANHLEALEPHATEHLAQSVGASPAEVTAALHQIAALDPKPGWKFSAPPPEVVIPEVEIEKTANGSYRVEGRGDLLPQVRISDAYIAMLEDPKTRGEAKKYLNEKISSGKLVVHSLEQRQGTIRRIAEIIAKEQSEFFEHGISKMKPMTMRSLAQLLGVHETTIGRAVFGKYVRTPQGVFELRFFFAGGFQTADGSGLSGEAVKSAVIKAIQGEDMYKPLSDQAIAEKLAQQGTTVARRTVAKYREAAGLPPAHERKIKRGKR